MSPTLPSWVVSDLFWLSCCFSQPPYCASVMLGNGCGHTLLGTESGTLASQNYPGTYPNNILCKWRLRVPESQTLRLLFGDFDIESSPDCSNGSLVITDRNGVRLLGKLVYLVFTTLIPDHAVFWTLQTCTHVSCNCHYSKIPTMSLPTLSQPWLWNTHRPCHSSADQPRFTDTCMSFSCVLRAEHFDTHQNEVGEIEEVEIISWAAFYVHYQIPQNLICDFYLIFFAVYLFLHVGSPCDSLQGSALYCIMGWD